MTIAELLRRKIPNEVNKSEAARELDISRQTLDHWLGGIYTPELEKREELAEFTGLDPAYILAVILVEKGVEPSEFKGLAEHAKGVYISSNQPLQTQLFAA
jgi:transcriptional regulator with XRE-family HTH domain